MRLGLRLFFAFFLIAGLSSFLLLRVVLTEVKPSVREVMEDIMVDTANLLAELALDDLAALPPGGDLRASRFAERVQDYARRPIDAQIWGLRKQSLDFRIYVTDARGRVLLDTGPGAAVGADYSRWRDVALTLRGDYGARSSRATYGDDRSTVLYVAAPVRRGQQVLGVVTVAKPVATIQPFIDRAERRILIAGLALLALSLAVGVAVTWWMVASVRRLRRYAQQVQAGRREPPPPVPGELGELALAMDAMRGRLDGREHIEHTVRALTHELKSPLAALRGAGELLQEELAPADRQRFAGQVVAQSERLTELVERLLELSKLELQQGPGHPALLRLDQAVEQALARLADRLAQQDLTPHWTARAAPEVRADPELLALALANLLGNALDFAPAGSVLELAVRVEGTQAVFELRDQGPGVPEAARPQLGQRFFSTARPGSLRKGSGLGLAIVRRVAELHGGRLAFEPAEPGLRVRLFLPLA
ncbi:two-component system sensor histidine kinase CreC [Roseateles sp. DAIF2]|uniref:two-component system sensor histidine kinase CreC n=1 Tax=Roseateles sp. DAIF2 TaxID=2714952 RepID=UPI0018A24EF3|nr:two-component system sensor histidine kinase CreC [Roseateles sp. DAIF2]QPF76308.1 two-component system sensor histidine kinase CreC [Roseateles sp. DAIF2]